MSEPLVMTPTWQERLDLIVETMREMSTHTDPQAMVRDYAARMQQVHPTDRMVALSRRDTQPPFFRVTRSSDWKEDINPWREKHRLPVLQGGLLGELLYGERPRVIGDLQVDPSDPGYEYLEGMRSLMALPNFDRGEALNMVLMMQREPHAFDPRSLADMVWMSNLFGRATHNLVLHDELQQAYNLVDQEMQAVADIQRSLLPAQLPRIPNLELAAHYQTSRRAGGDYYDFFPLPGGRWGILIADVSGHGTPAAVIMAITHSIAHTHPGPPVPPRNLLNYVNWQLTSRYTTSFGAFVTAFYGIYDPATRELRYSCAGHNPPRVKNCHDGSITSLEPARNLPLGISEAEDYEESVYVLRPGDRVILYTDGITEAMNAHGEQFGIERLDAVLEACHPQAGQLIESVLAALDAFTGGRPPEDDRTILVARVM